jgi:hypothetical protein
MGLVEPLRRLFRDGWLKISGAAVLAEYPEEDQNEFFEKYREEYSPENLEAQEYDPEEDYIRDFEIQKFLLKKSHFQLKSCMKGCADCKTRTHNGENELFKEEEFEDLGDVCLDSECYRSKWYRMIEEVLKERIEASPETENKIYFAYGVPKELYNKGTSVKFEVGGEGLFKIFDLLRDGKYSFTNGETNRKDKVCWKIGEAGDGQITVERVGYKEREKKATASGGTAGVGGKEPDKVDEYGREEIKAIAEYSGTTGEDIVKRFEDAKVNQWDFKREIRELVFEKVSRKKMEMKEEPVPNYFMMFLEMLSDETCLRLDDKMLNAEGKRDREKLLSGKTYEAISESFSEEAQLMFHWLLFELDFGENAVPDLKEIEEDKKRKKKSLFLKYSGMNEEEYRELYLEAAREASHKLLAKPNKKG